MITEVFDSAEKLHEAVLKYGFLPFFENEIKGFSIEEHTPADRWFTSAEGPWEWKGPVLRMGDVVYGKFFNNKAGYISLKWYPDFANFRRDGYDFDARMDDGLKVDGADINVYEELIRHDAILSKGLKKLTGYWGKEGKSGFETIITRLQMQGYVLTADFEYELDKKGQPYGWGIARYSTPEQMYGKSFIRKMYKRSPEESYERMFRFLIKQYPDDGRKIAKLLGYKGKTEIIRKTK